MPEMWEILEKEKAWLTAEVHEAFRDVSREGGVSYSETGVLDWGGTLHERAEARASDKDAHWTEILEDRSIIVECDSCWSFLDPIGFRYYLPIGLLRSLHYSRLQHSRDFGILWYLTLNEANESDQYNLREWQLNKWSLLDERQRRCIRRFIEYMIAYHKSEGSGEWYGWQAALDSYWITVGD